MAQNQIFGHQARLYGSMLCHAVAMALIPAVVLALSQSVGRLFLLSDVLLSHLVLRNSLNHSPTVIRRFHGGIVAVRRRRFRSSIQSRVCFYVTHLHLQRSRSRPIHSLLNSAVWSRVRTHWSHLFLVGERCSRRNPLSTVQSNFVPKWPSGIGVPYSNERLCNQCSVSIFFGET